MSNDSAVDVTSSDPEPIANYACETGENPLWHRLEQKLYWTDIPAGRLFRYDPSTGIHEQCYEGRPVGGFTIEPDGSFLLFMDRGTIAHWQNNILTEIVHEIPEELDSRFNDVIADPLGRVFCGTMSSDKSPGRLYRLDTDGTLSVLLEGIGCSNGMAFTVDRKHFYYTDSLAYEIYLFDYNVDNGSIRNQRVFSRFTESDGMPDGCTLDAEGHLWCALWDGSRIVRLDGNGVVDHSIQLPTGKVSSLTFAGSDNADIYITTAGGNKLGVDPLAGALFRVQAPVRGVPEFFSRIVTSDIQQTT
jgi:D-xylono/L-arabinono-1,4-lactonase